MNILCVIPARGGSKGLKDKNIISLCGKPLIGYTIEAALKSRLVNKVVVSTDDKKIAKVAVEYNVKVIKRPKEFATDSSPVERAIRHAVRYLEANDGYVPEITVWLQANVPIRKRGQIDEVIKKLISTRADSAVTVYSASQYPQWMKMMDKNGFLLPLFPGCREYRRQDIKALYLLDGAVVAIKTKVLMKTAGKRGVHVFMGKRPIGIMEDRKYALEIDDKEDMKLAGFYLSKDTRRL